MRTSRMYPLNESIVKMLAAGGTSRASRASIDECLPSKAVNMILSGGTTAHFLDPRQIKLAAAEQGYDATELKPLATTPPLTQLLKLELELVWIASDSSSSYLSRSEAVELGCMHRIEYNKAFKRMVPEHQRQHATQILAVAKYVQCPSTISEIAARPEISVIADAALLSEAIVPKEIDQEKIDQLLNALRKGPKTTPQLLELGIEFPASVVGCINPLEYEIETTLLVNPRVPIARAQPSDCIISYRILHTGAQ